MNRVCVGDVRRLGARDYVVLSVEHGRPGECRTVYVLGQQVGGRVLARETRGHEVRQWPRVDRLRLSVTRSKWGIVGEVLS